MSSRTRGLPSRFPVGTKFFKEFRANGRRAFLLMLTRNEERKKREAAIKLQNLVRSKKAKNMGHHTR